ncbi:MAG: 3,4-dihydroxy-2-butanone-4-phosphate synthase [Gammaproteobacteria bacterium]|nr:3,4-dihydroxy-2-butanone-4-phosphate synthase [Gammaproteobacteria bacterium]NNJ71925.1 3,4-dihydroxy-2-butanone-4-phosphate synthase [Enterobacterales bacterium]
MAFNTAEELIADIKQGKMVVLLDDEDRENEGDLVMAASHVNAEAVNFMAKFGRGLICLTLTKGRCEQLNLPLMVDSNQATFGTNFTLSIEAAEGVTTGISAADRARTIQAAVAPDAKPTDIVQPGHIFPLMAANGGVLNRAGHTEAGCDLARLAGLDPAAVIVEILNDDGTMARRPDLEVFAKLHGLKIGTIADLIEYRNLNEATIEPVSVCSWPTRYGEFVLHTFRDTIDSEIHHALVMGDVGNGEPVLTRVHVTNVFSDILYGERMSNKSWTLDSAIERVAKEGRGVVLIISHNQSNAGIEKQLIELSKQESGTELSNTSRQGGSRRVGIGSQILASLGAHQLRLLSNERRYYALSGFKIEIVDFVTE